MTLQSDEPMVKAFQIRLAPLTYARLEDYASRVSLSLNKAVAELIDGHTPEPRSWVDRATGLGRRSFLRRADPAEDRERLKQNFLKSAFACQNLSLDMAALRSSQAQLETSKAAALSKLIDRSVTQEIFGQKLDQVALPKPIQHTPGQPGRKRKIGIDELQLPAQEMRAFLECDAQLQDFRKRVTRTELEMRQLQHELYEAVAELEAWDLAEHSANRGSDTQS